MFDPITIIFDQYWQTYTLALMVGIGMGIAWVVRRAPIGQRGAYFDVCLASLLGAILLGRALYVLLHWAFFADHLDSIWQIQRDGGLAWQGILTGAALMGVLFGHRRRVAWRTVSRVQAVVIMPLIACLGWYGCATAACAYGAEVAHLNDYPAWLVWDRPNIYGLVAPRFATQRFGMVWTLGVLLYALWLIRYDYWRQGRFFGIVLLLALGSFLIGFWRADYSLRVLGLRIEQLLDLGLIIGSILMIGIFKDRAVDE